MNISERIKERCKEVGTNPRRIEQELNLSNGYIGKIKDDTVQYGRISRIAEKLQTTPEYLIYGITEKPVVVEIDRLSCERHMIRQIERLSDYQLKILSDIMDEMTGGDNGDR